MPMQLSWNSNHRLRGRCRSPGLRWLGQRGSAIARRAPWRHDRSRQLLTRRRERLGLRIDQSTADHRRPPLGGCGRAGRNPDRRRDDSPERRYRRIRSQSRRPDRPTAIDAGHVECPRASSRAQPGVRGRHAESRLYRFGNPANTGSKWIPTAMRRPSSCAKAKARCTAKARRTSSIRGNRIASREPACASTRYVDAPRLDEFDRWSSDRDRSYDTLGLGPLCIAGRRRLSGPRCQRHVARRRGLRQRLGPESRGRRLGAVPRRALGVGRPLGLDWVDDAPWGFAVSHYGRWANFGGTWGWVPGPVRTRAYYAPALVAFVGGSNFQLAISSGNVGGIAWFPLGPRDVYRAVLYGEPRLFRERQPQQHGHQHHRHQQLLQQHERDQRRVRQPASAGRRRRGSDDHVRAVAAGAKAAVRVTLADGCQRAGSGHRAGRADRKKRARRRRPRRQAAAAARIRAARRRSHRARLRRTSDSRAQQQQLAAKPGKPLDDAARKELKPAAAAPAPGRQSGDADASRAADPASADHAAPGAAGERSAHPRAQLPTPPAAARATTGTTRQA